MILSSDIASNYFICVRLRLFDWYNLSSLVGILTKPLLIWDVSNHFTLRYFLWLNRFIWAVGNNVCQFQMQCLNIYHLERKLIWTFNGNRRQQNDTNVELLTELRKSDKWPLVYKRAKSNLIQRECAPLWKMKLVYHKTFNYINRKLPHAPHGMLLMINQ